MSQLKHVNMKYYEKSFSEAVKFISTFPSHEQLNYFIDVIDNIIYIFLFLQDFVSFQS